MIVAGEPSGDAQAAELVEAARELAPGLGFFGAVGPALEEAGAERVVATSDLSVMGLFEVLSRLTAVRRAMGRLERAAADRRPVGAVLVDFPDFNLRLAARLWSMGIPVVQYVSPTVWAWRPGRIRAIERNVDRLLVTLPFEVDAYEGTGVDAVYVGHPAADRVPRALPPRAEIADRLGLPAGDPWVALLPGSRAGELGRMGPLLAAAAARVRAAVPEAGFLVPLAPGVDRAAVVESMAGGPAATFVARERHAAMAHCAAAIATSGTVSLELALLGVPHVVSWRTSPPTWWIARALVDIEHVALPNLIAGRTVVPELLQRAATPEALAAPVVTWLVDPEARREAAGALAPVAEAVGPPGAGKRAARAALETFGIIPPRGARDRV